MNTDLALTVRTMDSREIARLTNKDHGHVCRDIQEMLGRLNGLNQSSFGAVYRAGNGEERKCYALPYRETMILVSGYSVELRARIVDRWLELERETLPATPRTLPEALRLAADLEEKRLALVAQVEAEKPKVEAFDRFLSADGTLCIMDAAKTLGQPPLKFFDKLEAAGMIFKRGGDWLPTQYYIEKAYFEVKARTYGEGEKAQIKRQTRVTPKGLDGLAKLFRPAGQVSA
jgi:phage antirepressor YoqD-like protein